tara:strand:- start:12145 stop:12618 length:474 start_codon:yes stop_codon:yes gene_type:complete
MLRAMRKESFMKKSWCLFGAVLSLFLVMGGVPVRGEEETARLLSDLDLPLMEKFHEEEDSRVVFDTPEGRIIEVRAQGAASPEQVRDYYRLVLPTLSWQLAFQDQAGAAAPSDEGACAAEVQICLVALRDKEILSISISKDDSQAGVSVVVFDLRPR